MTPTASTPPEQFAECGGYRVAYAVAGEGTPSLVLIPGLPGSARDFRWLAPPLSGWARVVRFDPPGYGSSPRPSFTGMSAMEKARVVSALIDLLDVDQVVLVGHSFGSVVAAETVALQPDRVSSLVLLAPPGVQAHFPVAVVRTASRALGTAAGRSALRVPQRLAYRAAGFPSFLTDDELAMTTLDSGLADFRSYRAALAAADRPTMIAYALDDGQVPARNSAGLHRIAAPGPRVAFASGGHNIQKTRAEELSAFIRSFVTG